MSENKNTVTIDISGYGGELVLGEITEEQHEYWTTLGDDELETYCHDAFDYVDENRNFHGNYEINYRISK